MPTFTGSRKRQARLNLTPLPSSSPASKGYHQQIQERAAAVDYEGSPAKRRKVLEDVSRAGDPLPPTPSASRRPTTNDSDDELLQPTPKQSQARATRKAARQQRLDFSNAVPLSSANHPINLDQPLGLTAQSGERHASSDDSDELPSPGKLMRKSKREQKTSSAHKDDGFMGSSGRRITRGSQKRFVTNEEDSEDDMIVVHSSRSRTAARPVSAEIDVEDEQTGEEDMPTTGGKVNRKRTRRSSFISSSPPRAEVSDDDVQIVERPRSQRTGPRRESDEAEDEEDDDIVPFPPGRRKSKPSRQLTQQEQEDLHEDLDFLGPSSDVDEGRSHRAQSSQKNARLKALERLKQKRSSQGALPDISENDADDIFEDEGDETPVEAEDDEDGQGEGDDEEVVYAPTSSRAMFHAEKEDEEFLVDEGDDNELGIPEGIPLQFTRYASMKAKELWKFAVEWLVQKKINPAFPQMHDEIYELAFRKLDDEVSGLVGSKFASAAWTTDFTIAFRSRPAIAYDRLDRNKSEHMFNDKCDACNRTGHPATYQVQFQGKPYHRDTLDDVDNDDGDDQEDSGDGDSSISSDDSDDTSDYDAKGNEVKPASHIWYVGKFCMNNARTAHALQHWRLHLYHFVSDWIEQRYNSAEQLRKRDKMSVRKKRKLARRIADRMQDEGQTTALWKEFRHTLSEAANAKQQGRFSMESP
ncbi:hypothetical protein LTR95_005373 [Oleoguttula sp. CCFEE 5521]